MLPEQKQKLIGAAIEARRHAYAPYSKFRVGAALLDQDGHTFVGCNVENASYGMTICAERVAVASAVAGGSRHFVALAVATPGGHAPCGACRQVLAEFCQELPILLIDTDRAEADEVLEARLSELLPGRFSFET